MFQLALGLLVVVLGVYVSRKPASPSRSRMRGRLSRANNLASGLLVVVVGCVLALFGLLDLANNG